ncbi:MAG: GNAT family N-acetyltransferase [Desulfobacterota bacterium]|nr:GNAT family N-acetyltransferase [Thermodesulfobacteriota bacterium]
MQKTVAIIQLEQSRRDIKRFLSVPYAIYRNDPNWVAPLQIDRISLLLPSNPFFEHADIAFWIATRGGQDVGTIAAIVDDNYNAFHHEKAAFFGFFECINDAAVARALLDVVLAWAQQQGATHVLGPMNPSTNEECGLLVEGFSGPPTLMMPYNPPYYAQLLETGGFTKAKDLLAFYVDVAACPLDRLARIADRTLQRHTELKLQPVTRKTMAADLAKIKTVYNSAWEANWGFVPMTAAEIDFMAARLKPLFREGLVWYAEWNGSPVGFLLALPDYNIALKHLHGKLISKGIVRALPYLAGWRVPPRCRVVTLGVTKEYRNRGIEAAMLAQGFTYGMRMGITEAEASWVLEDNTVMCRMMEFFGGRVYRRYRIYGCKL